MALRWVQTRPGWAPPGCPPCARPWALAAPPRSPYAQAVPHPSLGTEGAWAHVYSASRQLVGDPRALPTWPGRAPFAGAPSFPFLETRRLSLPSCIQVVPFPLEGKENLTHVQREAMCHN